MWIRELLIWAMTSRRLASWLDMWVRIRSIYAQESNLHRPRGVPRLLEALSLRNSHLPILLDLREVSTTTLQWEVVDRSSTYQHINSAQIRRNFRAVPRRWRVSSRNWTSQRCSCWTTYRIRSSTTIPRRWTSIWISGSSHRTSKWCQMIQTLSKSWCNWRANLH